MRPNVKPHLGKKSARVKRARKIDPAKGMALRRLSEIKRLLMWRERLNAYHNDHRGIADVIAESIVLAGLPVDVLEFEKIAGRLIDLDLAAERLRRAEERVDFRDFAPYGAATAGYMLGLTTEERLDCEIRTLVAIDERPDDRAKHVRDRKRRRDRDRQRRKRAEAGRMTRAEYEGQSASRTRPWEAMGMSRAKWYRFGKPTERETSVSLHTLILRGDRPVSRGAAVDPSLPKGENEKLRQTQDSVEIICADRPDKRGSALSRAARRAA